jgi:hypothetical protein
LVADGVNFADSVRRTASFVDFILRGATQIRESWQSRSWNDPTILGLRKSRRFIISFNLVAKSAIRRRDAVGL